MMCATSWAALAAAMIFGCTPVGGGGGGSRDGGGGGGGDTDAGTVALSDAGGGQGGEGGGAGGAGGMGGASDMGGANDVGGDGDAGGGSDTGGAGGAGGAGGMGGEGGGGGMVVEPAGDVGQPCDSDDDCERICFLAPDFPGGYCTADCREDPCADTDECFFFGADGEAAFCLRSCMDDGDCRADDGYVCDADATCYPAEVPGCRDEHDPNDAEDEATDLGDVGDACDGSIEVQGQVSPEDADWFRVAGVGSDRCPMFAMHFIDPADFQDPPQDASLYACVFGRCADGSDPEFNGCFLPQEDSPAGLPGCCSEVPSGVGAPWLEIHCAEPAVEYFVRVTAVADQCVNYRARLGPQRQP